MSTNPTRPCPLCDAMESSVTFPYRTRFNEVQFNYLKCSACSSVFVDPVPDSSTFAKMYAKAHYHDLHYKGIEGGVYSEAATAVKEYLLPGATVLDYGCGIGAFMKALVREGFIPYGVEFDEAAARYAGQNANCQTFSLDQFVVLSEMREIPKFDAIHLGDVLEHLPDPARVLRNLLGHLKHDGILFVEGPLEIKPKSSLLGCSSRWLGQTSIKVSICRTRRAYSPFSDRCKTSIRIFSTHRAASCFVVVVCLRNWLALYQWWCNQASDSRRGKIDKRKATIWINMG